MSSRRYLTLPILFAGIVWLGGASAAEAQSVRRVGPERVTVKADGIPLGDLLDQLAAIAPLESVTIDPLDRAVPVSLVAEDVYPLVAIGLVLKASGLDFVMSSTRILAGRAKKALEASAGASAARLEPTDSERPDAKLEKAQEPPVAEPPPPSVDEHDLVQAAVPVLPPAPSSVVERPGELTAGSWGPAATENLFDKKRQPASQMFAKPTPDEFGRAVGAPVKFTIHEDSVTITQQGFVPYKVRPEVVNRRLAAKIGDIP
jgi:hypothetical protein